MAAVSRTHTGALIAAIAGLAVASAGCGGGSDPATVADRPAPPAADFPSTDGKDLQQLVQGVQSAQDIVVAPTQKVFEPGENRFGFGVFDVGGDAIPDAEVALYVAPHEGGPAAGPYPARAESLEVDSQFESQTTAQDPDAAHVVYVTDVKLGHPGPWDVVAMVRQGDAVQATALPTVQVGGHTNIPNVGERPPAIHTPTVEDVGGDVAKIDTRAPHDDMHDVDFADVLGKQPVVLVFATPALCQSRVCGPVVDVEEEVKSEFSDQGVDFIHMEVYNDNDPNKGLRPQMTAFHLPTEPWAFVVGADGRVSTRIEGAFGATELRAAVQKVSG